MTNPFDDETPVIHESPLADVVRGGGALSRVQTRYMTAVRVEKPRELERIKSMLIQESQLGGEEFYYSWNVKGKGGKPTRVEGGSIGLASTAARLWGNCVWTCNIEKEDDDSWDLVGLFCDLETGFNMERPFRQRKDMGITRRGEEGGGYGEARALDMAFQVGVSKCMRNLVLRSLPKSLLDQAIAQAKQAKVKVYEAMIKQPKQWQEMIGKVLKAFEKFKVDEAMLEKVVGPTKGWTPKAMVEMEGMVQALKDGYSVAEVFGLEEEAPAMDEPSEAQERLFWKASGLKKREDKEALLDYMREYCKLSGRTMASLMQDAMGGMEEFLEGWRKVKTAERAPVTKGGKPKGKPEEKEKGGDDQEPGEDEQREIVSAETRDAYLNKIGEIDIGESKVAMENENNALMPIRGKVADNDKLTDEDREAVLKVIQETDYCRRHKHKALKSMRPTPRTRSIRTAVCLGCDETFTIVLDGERICRACRLLPPDGTMYLDLDEWMDSIEVETGGAPNDYGSYVYSLRFRDERGKMPKLSDGHNGTGGNGRQKAAHRASPGHVVTGHGGGGTDREGSTPS
jgi:hypothetical protein